MNEGEKNVVGKMIDIYCQAKHGKTGVLCKKCYELKTYAMSRLDKCAFGAEKPTCRTCTIHCYKKDMKEEIKTVMKFAGPRMMFFYPKEAFQHFYKEIRRKKVRNALKKTS
jgi:hypothetical protein